GFEVDLGFDSTNLGCSGDFCEADFCAATNEGMADGCFRTALDDVLAKLDGAIENDGVAFSARVFDHHDGVGALRDGGGVHALNAGSGSDRSLRSVSGFEFADEF